MRTFYNQNKKILSLFVLNQMAIWSFVALLPMVLSKYYGFSDALLSYLVTIFVVSFFAGTAYMNVRLENRINYTKTLFLGLVVVAFMALLSFCVFYFEYNKYLYLVLRGIDGFFTGMLSVLVGYVTKSIMLPHPKNGLLVSVQSFVTYLIKGGWPIFVSLFLLFSGFEIFIFLYGLFFYLVALGFLYYHRERFTYQYQRVVRKAQGRKIKHRGFFTSLYRLRFFFKDNLKEKIHYIVILSMQNINRPFYDLYMVLFLMNYHGLSIVQTTSMISMMVFGQASQMLSGYLSDKITLSDLRLYGLVVYIVPIVLIICVPEVVEYQLLGMVVFYIFGVGRSFYAQYAYKLELNLIQRGEKINRVSLVHNVIGEAFHYFSYMFLGFVLYVGYKVQDMMYLIFIPIFIYSMVWVVYDRKQLNRKF